MKKTKLLIWLIVILIVSGWLCFFIEYASSKKQIAQLQIKVEQMDSQLKAVGDISNNINESIANIDRMISEFEKIKTSLQQVRTKIEKASKL